ncbi:MAG TPA: hypothetical protein VK796_03150, partial [Cytophaga sp.]|nr:hypothetical protein [Cytophaga sp.]
MRFLTLTVLLFFTLTLAMAQNDLMKQRWNKIDTYLNDALPKSALTDLNKIYSEAKEKNDVDNQVKALIYIMRCNDMSEEDAFEKDITFIRKEIATAVFPVNAVLHSMLGEMYWQYFQRSYYRTANITNSTNADLNDIQTWDQKTILEAAIHAYHASLKNKDQLLEYSTDTFKEVIYKSSNHALTENLYDFLGRKALIFFQSTESSVSRPAEQFNLNDARYFGMPAEFITLTIQSTDTLSLHLYAMQLMQDLEKIHLNDTDPSTLIDLTIIRLKFVTINSALPNTDELRLVTLLKLEQASLKFQVSTDVSYEIAVIWHERAGDMSGVQNSPKYPDANITSVQICDAAIKRFPNAEGAHNCEQVKQTILRPSFVLTLEEVNIPQAPFRTLTVYNNIKMLSLRVIRLTANEAEKLKIDLDYKYDQRFELFKPYL